MDAETVQHMRAADALVRGGKANNFKQALLQVLGRYTPPVPSESAQQILQRLDRLEAKVNDIAETVTWIADYLRQRSTQRAQTAQSSMTTLISPTRPGQE